MENKKPTFFIGYDSKEDIAYRVCKQSLLKNSSSEIEQSVIELRAASKILSDSGVNFNILPGTIVDSLEQGSVSMLTVDTGLRFKVVVTPQSFRELNLSNQKAVFLSFKASAVKIYQ